MEPRGTVDDVDVALEVLLSADDVPFCLSIKAFDLGAGPPDGRGARLAEIVYLEGGVAAQGTPVVPHHLDGRGHENVRPEGPLQGTAKVVVKL
jgi:hypothetical protein